MALSTRPDDAGGIIDPAILPPRGERPNRTMQQRMAEGNLARHPYQLELRGTLDSLSWPSVCAWCGRAAAARVRVPKPFLRPRTARRRVGNGMQTPIIRSADVPFCTECIARHEATVQRPAIASQLVRMLFTPILIPIVGSAIMATIATRAALGMSPGDARAWIPWSLTGFFLLVLFWSVAGAWRASHTHGIEKQTDVTLACDFSDDVSRVFEGERRLYAMRNREFAESFAALNRGRVWTEEDDRRAHRRSMILAGITLAVAAIFWVYSTLGP